MKRLPPLTIKQFDEFQQWLESTILEARSSGNACLFEERSMAALQELEALRSTNDPVALTAALTAVTAHECRIKTLTETIIVLGRDLGKRDTEVRELQAQLDQYQTVVEQAEKRVNEADDLLARIAQVLPKKALQGALPAPAPAPGPLPADFGGLSKPGQASLGSLVASRKTAKSGKSAGPLIPSATGWKPGGSSASVRPRSAKPPPDDHGGIF